MVEGSGATRSLTVEQVKELTADAYRAPEEADVSVYILQMGTKPLEPAQNKLLKLIEEPPAHGVFLLLCRSAEQLLPTIRSRVQSFLLQPPEEEEAAAFLKNRPEELEVAVTGRDPSPALLAEAGYVSEIRAVRHPYEQGVSARRGIEY